MCNESKSKRLFKPNLALKQDFLPRKALKSDLKKA